MLISLDELYERYNLKVSGVLHVGAHLGEEAEAYQTHAVPEVWWVEGNPTLIPALERHVGRYGHQVINALVSSTAADDVDFHVTKHPTSPNGTMSSSLLHLERHLIHDKSVSLDYTVKLPTTTIDALHAARDFSRCNFLNMDIQGAELMALEGAMTYLPHVDYIYIEVNEGEVYKGCALVGDLDAFLDRFGFGRREVHWTGQEWGDAFYVRG